MAMCIQGSPAAAPPTGVRRARPDVQVQPYLLWAPGASDDCGEPALEASVSQVNAAEPAYFGNPPLGEPVRGDRRRHAVSARCGQDLPGSAQDLRCPGLGPVEVESV